MIKTRKVVRKVVRRVRSAKSIQDLKGKVEITDEDRQYAIKIIESSTEENIRSMERFAEELKNSLLFAKKR